MLREIRVNDNISPYNESTNTVSHRWFEDDYFHLFVWYDKNANITGFQLCYDRHRDERSITWKKDKQGITHNRIDEGDGSPLKNMSPVLVQDGVFPYQRVKPHFENNSKEIDPEITELVLNKLDEYANL